MATVYARGNSQILQWFENGKQQRKSLGRITPDEAAKFCKEKEFELRTGRKIFTGCALFEDHLVGYIDWHAVQFPSSHFRVKQICEQCFEDFYGKPLNAITQKDIEIWLTSRLKRTWVEAKGRKRAVVSSETAAKELRTLKAVLNKGVDWEAAFIKSPAAKVAKPKNVNSKPPHWYSVAELTRLYKDSKYAPIWRLVANTGMRRAEAQKLEWQHVHWDKETIDVESSEGNRTKSGKWREIPLTSGALLALKELKLQTGTLTYVLPRMAGPSLSRCFRLDAAARKLGGSLHSLRHTYAAHLVMAGVPMRTLQKLMGHARSETTERYAHIGADHLRDKAKSISL